MSLLRIGYCLLVAGLAGCVGVPPLPRTPTAAGVHPADLHDPAAEADTAGPITLAGLYREAEQIRRDRRPPVLPPKRSVLVLSGGGSYGAYSAGVLCGWTRRGDRPRFDVVTGISTGALVAALAFAGPEYDLELQRAYTTLTNDDIFRIKHSLQAILSDGVADNAPLARQISRIVTQEFLRKVAAEHAAGRRLYVGTTDLDGRRQVVWDLGAIASRGTPDAQDLFVRVLLASAAIPGLFPPVSIPVTVDGKRYEERHVDGGVTAALFFRPPHVPPEKRADPAAASLYDSDLYVIVAGKLYAEPQPVSPLVPWIAETSVSTLIDSQTRADLYKLYTAAMLTGMNYKIAAIPQEFDGAGSSTEFDPKTMGRLFDEGVRQATAGTAWRTTPPGLEPGEQAAIRGGVELTRTPTPAASPVVQAGSTAQPGR